MIRVAVGTAEQRQAEAVAIDEQPTSSGPDGRQQAPPVGWDTSAEERERLADERDDVAVDRDVAADSRDGLAVGRDGTADGRDSAADGRDGVADGRDSVAQLRDELAALRDQLAELRDDVADHRDRDADLRDDRTATLRSTTVAGARAPRAAGERVRVAARHRRDVAAGGRLQAGRDRELALAERHAAAGDRLRAARYREDALLGRHTADLDRRSAVSARDVATTGRETAADDRQQAGLDRLEELDRRLTWDVVLAMLASVPDAVVAVDSDGLIAYVNDQGESLFGWSRIDLLGQSIEVLVPAQHVAQHPALRAGYLAQPTARPMAAGAALSARRRDGSEFPAEISLSPTTAGPHGWVLAAIRDVTDARQFAHDLETARSEAVRANAAKDEFLSRMSHELRTPLNAILGFGQLLEMDELAADQSECVAQIAGAGRHLLALVDEVLDISQMAQGSMRLSLEPVVLREVVDEAIAMLRPLADRQQIRLSHALSPDIRVVADRLRLKQVVMNLLVNAVKYNRSGGSVVVDGDAVGPGRFRTTVTDTGIGMADADLSKLFTPFERLASTPLQIEGTGLGLALAKHLVSAMHGEIGVTSLVGVGSSFWFELPAVDAATSDAVDAASAAALDAADSARVAKVTVLYIEDNPSNIRLLEKVVTRRPEVALMVAMTGQLGLDLAFEHRPQLILLDLGLPDMAGEDVLRRLKADPRTASTPVVVITADAMPRRPEEVRAMGAVDYITKPFDVLRLLALLDESTTST